MVAKLKLLRNSLMNKHRKRFGFNIYFKFEVFLRYHFQLEYIRALALPNFQ